MQPLLHPVLPPRSFEFDEILRVNCERHLDDPFQRTGLRNENQLVLYIPLDMILKMSTTLLRILGDESAATSMFTTPLPDALPNMLRYFG